LILIIVFVMQQGTQASSDVKAADAGLRTRASDDIALSTTEVNKYLKNPKPNLLGTTEIETTGPSFHSDAIAQARLEKKLRKHTNSPDRISMSPLTLSQQSPPSPLTLPQQSS
jgi:hypothetical protein